MAAAEVSVGLALALQLHRCSRRWMSTPQVRCEASFAVIALSHSYPAFRWLRILVVLGRWLNRTQIATIGVGSVGLSALIAILVGFDFIISPPADHSYTQSLWVWIKAGDFSPHIAFYLDSLSVIMVMVVTFVGFLIHLYSAEYMEEEDGYARFFASMNLFLCSM